LTWPLSAHLALVLMLTAALFFLLGRWSQERAANPVAAAEAQGPRLDLNRASAAELRLLPGVSAALAQRILDYRRQSGPFRSIEDLRRVSGVGPKALERLRPWLFVVVPESAEAEESEIVYLEPMAKPVAKTSASRKQVSLTALIDVNQADLAELQKLPGIGPKLSQRIVDERTLRGPFKTVEELRRVSGIGVKTLDRLRPLVTVEGQKRTPPTSQPAASVAYNE
jgi:competence protein ComEA